MKLGTKTNLITAYSALFTVAFGVLAWDFVRRASSHAEERGVAERTTQVVHLQGAKALASR